MKQNQRPRLTELAHGGGCGCKLAPGVLQSILSNAPMSRAFPQLLVGNAESDDAAVWQVDETTCIVATTDFFMPMVDDPRDFGRIAATNAISDIYAMGARPVMALAIVGMPVNLMPADMIREILDGGAEVCANAGVALAGGHSIDAPEPIYGLAVIGLLHPSALRRNGGAGPGDRVILTKGLGVGIYSAAIKKRMLDADGIAEMVGSATTLNSIGAVLSARPEVRAMTDVTGFGILGHGLEMARASGGVLALDYAALPRLSRADDLARAGCVTGASGRNWDSYGADVDLSPDLPDHARALLTDPQTSGGLLIAVQADAAEAILAEIRAAGLPLAAIIGEIAAGGPSVRVR